ncbi:MAG: hypothetical protein GC155_08260 [Alphaproteobacteria bacterium]|nr:hypothetical protein [Alphaproteobacteria bacterium]
MISRRIRYIRPASREGQVALIADALQYPALVLLGDPGSGKSTCFSTLHELEQGVLLTAKAFSVYGARNSAGRALYVDALDEKRPRTAPEETTETLIQRLVSAEPPKLRISCRTINWLGVADETDFGPLFENIGEYAVVRLEPLSLDETKTLLQELGVSDADAFVYRALERGVQRLLESPQTLTMLARQVQYGDWPSNRRELFDAAARDMLTEVNPRHQLHVDGQYVASELRSVAGALSATLLVSDTARLSLPGATPDENTPPLRALPVDEDLLFASVSRMLFEADPQRGVSPPHRTVAEFLAAEWLAAQVRQGLSLRRVLALISSEGSPAEELRGLFGWLPATLPDHAQVFLAADPYGVVTHGTPECLTPSNKRVLFAELARLSRAHPGFRRGDWPNPKLAVLSDIDLASEFRAALVDPDVPYDLLMTVLDALRFGPPQPGFGPELCAVMARPDEGYAAAEAALAAALRAGQETRAQAIAFLRASARGRSATVRLRVHAAQELFPAEFDAGDVAEIIRDFLNRESDNTVGLLWELKNLAPRISAEALDQLCDSNLTRPPARDMSHGEVRSALIEWIESVLSRDGEVAPDRLWCWLQFMASFRDHYFAEESDDGFRDQLRTPAHRPRQLFRIALNEADPDRLAGFWSHFTHATAKAFTTTFFLQEAIALIVEGTLTSERQSALYGFALRSSFGTEYFDQLYDMAKSSPLQEVRRRACYWEIEAWREEQQERRERQLQKERDQHERNVADFDAHVVAIEAGTHVNWLGHLARYFYFRSDGTLGKVAGIPRVEEAFGADRAGAVRRGLIALTDATSWPSPEAVVDEWASDKYFTWWMAAVAGMDERWDETRLLVGLSDDALAASSAMVWCYGYMMREGLNDRDADGWLAAAFRDRPDLMRRTLLTCIRRTPDRPSPHTPVGLDDFLYMDAARDIHGEVAVELLMIGGWSDQTLSKLLKAALSDSHKHGDLRSLTRSALADTETTSQQRPHWLAAAFWLDFTHYEAALRIHYATAPNDLWIIRALSAETSRRRMQDRSAWSILTTEQSEFLIAEFGAGFARAEHPEDGSIGDTNPWDATDFVQGLANILSGRAGRDVGAAFNRLCLDDRLLTHRETLMHFAGNQRELTRQKEYVRPSWDETIRGLFTSAPATVADLHALVVDDLEEIARVVRVSNTDSYKAFWNEAPGTARVSSPKVEESCRDRLLDLLRSALRQRAVSAEPEGHMAADRRCDIVAAHDQAGKVVIEIKRDAHPEVWSACRDQLDRLYTRDPDAKGYGVYLVIWHGRALGRGAPAPPSGVAAPGTADEMQVALTSLVPEADRHRIKVIVIDVTPLPAA